MKRRKGFTLVEILAVIGIILVLIGLSIPAFRHLSQAAAQRETITELHICRGLLQEYEIHNGIGFLGTGSAGAPTGDTGNRNSGSMRYTTGVVKNTMTWMAILAQVPANRTVLQSIPNKRILEANGAGTPNNLDQGIVILDGWGDPIILVPPGGLVVQIKDPDDPTGVAKKAYTVRTSGMYPAGSVPLVGKADRPFFASAGQDADFSVGEDNVYSFQD